MSMIKLFLTLAIVANQMTAARLTTRMEEIYADNLNAQDFSAALTEAISSLMNLHLNNANSLEELVYELAYVNQNNDFMSIFETKFDNKPLEEVFTEIFTDELEKFYEGQELPLEKLLEAYNYFMNKELYQSYLDNKGKLGKLQAEDSDAASDALAILIQEAGERVNSKIISTFNTFQGNMTKKVEGVQTNLNENMANLATNINIEHFKNYRDFIDNPKTKIINAVDTLIERASEPFDKKTGPAYGDRIVYFAKSLIKLYDIHEDAQVRIDGQDEHDNWIDNIKVFIANLENLRRNTFEVFNPEYNSWNLETQRRLLQLLPREDAIDLVRNYMGESFTKTVNDGDYAKILKKQLENGEIVFSKPITDAERLRIVDLVGGNQELKLESYQEKDLIDNYDFIFGLEPTAYKTYDFSAKVAETYNPQVITSDEQVGLINKSYEARLTGNFDDDNFGKNIDTLLDTFPETKELLKLKLINLKTNLIDEERDVNVNIELEESQLEELVENKENVPEYMTRLLKKIYIYNKENQKLPRDFEIYDNLEGINSKTYNAKELSAGFDDEFEEEDEPVQEEDDQESQHPGDKIVQEELDDQVLPEENDDELIDDSQSNIQPSQDDGEDEIIRIDEQADNRSFVEPQIQPDLLEEEIEESSLLSDKESPAAITIPKNENIAFNLHGDIGEQNLDALRKIHGLKNYSVETKYIPYDADTDIELTIVYVDTVESPCFEQNGKFE